MDARGVRLRATSDFSNLDLNLLLLVREAGPVVRCAAFAQALRERLSQAMEAAAARYASRPWRVRVLDRIAFGIMRAALWVTGNRY